MFKFLQPKPDTTESIYKQAKLGSDLESMINSNRYNIEDLFNTVLELIEVTKFLSSEGLQPTFHHKGYDVIYNSKENRCSCRKLYDKNEKVKV